SCTLYARLGVDQKWCGSSVISERVPIVNSWAMQCERHAPTHVATSATPHATRVFATFPDIVELLGKYERRTRVSPEAPRAAGAARAEGRDIKRWRSLGNQVGDDLSRDGRIGYTEMPVPEREQYIPCGGAWAKHWQRVRR